WPVWAGGLHEVQLPCRRPLQVSQSLAAEVEVSNMPGVKHQRKYCRAKVGHWLPDCARRPRSILLNTGIAGRILLDFGDVVHVLRARIPPLSVLVDVNLLNVLARAKTPHALNQVQGAIARSFQNLRQWAGGAVN